MKTIFKHCPSITNLSIFPVDPYFGKFNPDDDENNLDTSAEPSSFGNAEIEADDTNKICGATDSSLLLDNDYSGFGASGSSKRPPPFYKYLKHTSCLQNLTTTSFVITSEAIEILASLPNLKRLTLHCSYPNEYIVYQLSPKYPEHPFRSLRTLELLLPDMECVSQVWSLGPLVSPLTDVTVHLQANGRVDDEDDDDDIYYGVDEGSSYTRNFLAFIPELCKRSPNIQNLIVDFDAAEGDTLRTVSLETVKSLASLPLKKLDLRHALLEKIAQACQVLKHCHTLRDLCLQDQKFLYDELLLLAQIPGLECLHAECSNPLHIEPDNAVFKDIAQFLCSCMPKLEEIAYVGTSMYGVGPGVLDPTYTALNEMHIKDAKGRGSYLFVFAILVTRRITFRHPPSIIELRPYPTAASEYVARKAFDRVLTIPELVALFPNLMSKKDLVNLARTSRGCFGSTIQHVWREVRGVHNLFGLIPGAKYRQGRLSIPDLTTADFTRFNLYGPLVSYLELLPSLHHAGYQFSDWDKLAKYTESAVLLPNLRSLVFASAKSRDLSFIHWITALLSPNLENIYTHSTQWTYEARISMPSAKAFLKTISERCPAIVELSIFPVEPFFSSYNPNYSDDSDYEDAPMFSTNLHTPSDNLSSSSVDYDIAQLFGDPPPGLPSDPESAVSLHNHGRSSNATAQEDLALPRELTPPVYYYEYLGHMHHLQTLTTT
ncbi:hypothetical protein FRC07_001264, partial [Ceratobasidium sp. 392]